EPVGLADAQQRLGDRELPGVALALAQRDLVGVVAIAAGDQVLLLLAGLQVRLVDAQRVPARLGGLLDAGGALGGRQPVVGVLLAGGAAPLAALQSLGLGGLVAPADDADLLAHQTAGALEAHGGLLARGG